MSRLSIPGTEYEFPGRVSGPNEACRGVIPVGEDGWARDRAALRHFTVTVNSTVGIIGRRLSKDEMLGNSEKGLSVEEVAELSGLALSTVRQYLSDQR